MFLDNQSDPVLYEEEYQGYIWALVNNTLQ